MSEETQKKFLRLTRKLGRLIREEADLALNPAKTKSKKKTTPKPKTKTKKKPIQPKWLSAFVDVRWFADAEGWSSKLRIVFADNSLFGKLDTTRDMCLLFRELWDVRKEDDSAEWYGLKVSVTHDGKITTELDTNPDCVIDPMWYRT